ncbi:hypothetical protein Bca4012_013793 [Brassica carinata]
MEPTGKSSVSSVRKSTRKTDAASATGKPNEKSIASSAAVKTVVSSASPMNPNSADDLSSATLEKPNGKSIASSAAVENPKEKTATNITFRRTVRKAVKTIMVSSKCRSPMKRDIGIRRPLHISGFTNRYEEKISSTPIVVRVGKIWPIINETNDMLGTAFLCFNFKGETLEGRLSKQLSTTNPNLLSAGNVYQLSDYMVLPNSRKYKLTPMPCMIHINEKTRVVKIEPTIPGFPTYKFSPLNSKELIESATTIFQLIIGLLLNRFTMVKLTLWENEASLFRQLQSKSNRKYKVVLVTSIIPNICKGKLLLSSSSATRFFFDENIKHISGFRGRIRICDSIRGIVNGVVPET